MINPEDIIAEKKYRAPYAPEMFFEELEKSINDLKVFPKCPMWLCISKGIKVRRYFMNPKYQYIINKMQIPFVPSDYEKFSKEYEKNRQSNYENTIKTFANSTPIELIVLIRNVNEIGVEFTASCHPALHHKLSKSFQVDEMSDFNIQDSKYNCIRFIDELFIGKLGSTVVEEYPHKRFVYKLLINDSTKREITNEIDKLLDFATTDISICGWMGTHYIPKLKQLKNQGVNVEFITHKPSEARGQPWKSEIEEAYSILCSDFGQDNISIGHNIHGRTLIVDNKVLIGSMDFNSSSLTGAHTEFAVLTDDPEIVRRMRAVFKSKFQS